MFCLCNLYGIGKENDRVFNNGVVLLGNTVNSCSVNKQHGLYYTDFNKTLSDALTYESILDMQGITEAVSKYYYKNGNSFKGISVAPEYQEKFEHLAMEAIEYYSN